MAKQKDQTGFKEILADLKKGSIASLYVFEGEETYLKNKLLKAIESLLIEPATKALDFIVFDYSNQVSKVNLPKIITETKTPPFMSKKRLVIVKNSSLFTMGGKGKKENNEDSEETDPSIEDENTSTTRPSQDRQVLLLDLLQSGSDSCCLVFVEDKVDKRMKVVIDAIQQNGVLASIRKPELRDIRQWVAGEFSKSKIQITPDTCDYLIDRNDGNLQNMVTEIEKLILFVQSKNVNQIGRIDIDQIASSDLKGSIFDIVDALSRKNAQEAYRILDLLLIQKQPVPLISFMLARHIRQLITAKELGNTDAIITKMKIIPFVASKLQNQARNFTFDALEDLYKECFESDLAVKTSKITDRLALEILFASTVNKITSDALIKKGI